MTGLAPHRSKTRALEIALAIRARRGKHRRGVWVNEFTDLDAALIRRDLRDLKTAVPSITPAAELPAPREIACFAPIEARPATRQHAPPTC